MTDDPIAVLTRWEQFGGTWHVVDHVGNSVRISMRRCDGGEQVEEMVSDSPELLAWLGDRTGGSAT